MRFLLIFVGIILLMGIGVAMGYLVAKTELKIKIRNEMERSGWSKEHQKIYHQAIGTLDRILRAHDLDAPMEFRTVLLPDNLRVSAQITVDRYRREIDA